MSSVLLTGFIWFEEIRDVYAAALDLREVKKPKGLGLTSMRAWVDVFYFVYGAAESHNRRYWFSAIISKSGKEKLNTKSSMKAELFRASRYMPVHHSPRRFKFLKRLYLQGQFYPQ